MPCPAHILGAILARASRRERDSLQSAHIGMQSEPSIPRRRSIRLPKFDYSGPGAYFITICARDKRPLFGRMCGTEVQLTKLGKIVAECWREIPNHFRQVELGVNIVMPEHLHGIILLRTLPNGDADAKNPHRARHAVPLLTENHSRQFAVPVARSIPTIIGAFKSAVSKRVGRFGAPTIWQRGYYEHVIRDADDFENTSEYIRMNPLRRTLKCQHS